MWAMKKCMFCCIFSRLAGGEGGIRTHYHHAESATCRFYVPHNATNATATKAACPTLPDGIDLMPDGAKAEAGSSKLLICFSKVLNQAASSLGIRSSFDNKELLRPWATFPEHRRPCRISILRKRPA